VPWLWCFFVAGLILWYYQGRGYHTLVAAIQMWDAFILTLVPVEALLFETPFLWSLLLLLKPWRSSGDSIFVYLVSSLLRNVILFYLCQGILRSWKGFIWGPQRTRLSLCILNKHG
jgi:hypothetical protein